MKINIAHKQLNLEDRVKIEEGINKGLSIRNIARTVNKSDVAINKEILRHRVQVISSTYPVDCSNFAHCKHKKTCSMQTLCSNYVKFSCKRRDKAPKACNGCSKYRLCRYSNSVIQQLMLRGIIKILYQLLEKDLI